MELFETLTKFGPPPLEGTHGIPDEDTKPMRQAPSASARARKTIALGLLGLIYRSMDYFNGDRPVNALYRGDGFAGYAADAAQRQGSRSSIRLIL